MEPNDNEISKSEKFESVDLQAPPSSNDQEISSSPSRGGHEDIHLNSASSNSIQMGPPDTWAGDEADEAEGLDVKMPARPSFTNGSEKGGMKMTDGDDDDDLESPSSSTSQKDGIVKPPAKKKKKKPQMNPKFKDVHETGKWGELSKKELIIAISLFVAVIVAAVLVVLFVVILPNNEENSGGNNSTDSVSYVPAPTLAPTPPPTNLPPQAELDLVLDAIQANPVTTSLIETGAMSEEVSFYQGLVGSFTATPQQKAMSWLLFQDEMKDPTQSVLRFAFASIYFQNGGEGWASANGWLTSSDVCDWDHIDCDSRGFMQEVDMSEQNVSGNLALEFALLGENLQSILMSRNSLEGPIPAEVFSSLPRLGLLYLDNNLLTGDVPVELVSDARLHTLYLQFNDLTGVWPLAFCAEDTSLMDFGLDCDQLTCDPTCCTPLECYYDE
ncbi:MAG: hypothetical protein SGARI_000430 [Bacillariaceae sp.]